jgi:phosphate transport system substrate-binding protein
MVLVAAAIAAPWAALQANEPLQLRLQGSTTFHARLVEPYRSRIEELAGVKLHVIPNKSIWGLVSLIERRADLAMISARLDSEMDALRKVAGADAGRDLAAFEIARSRVAFAVHPSNPVRAMTNAQLRAVLLGQVRNWKELGGADLPIRVVATQDGGGTVAAVRAQVLDGQPISSPDAIRLESAKHVVAVASQEPGAIAIAQLSLANERKLPEVVTPTPVEQILCLVTLGKPTPPMTAFIEASRKVAVEAGL